MCMQLTSPAFIDGGMIPDTYGCKGDNINPPLHIEGTPEGTKSLALIMEDPDVPREIRPDGMWDHWIIWNMPPHTEEILEAQGPREGVLGRNTRGAFAYGGPCPPDQPHRYFFKLFALDIWLDLAPGSDKAALIQAMEGHKLATAQLMGMYSPK